MPGLIGPCRAPVEGITQLGVGEALVSTLEAKGVPSMVERTLIRPPASRMGPLRPEERRAIMDDSPVSGIYDRSVDRESAYEMLAAAAARKTAAAEANGEDAAKPAPGRRSDTAWEAGIKSVVRSVSSSVGREIARRLMRGVLGSLSR